MSVGFTFQRREFLQKFFEKDKATFPSYIDHKGRSKSRRNFQILKKLIPFTTAEIFKKKKMPKKKSYARVFYMPKDLSRHAELASGRKWKILISG